MPPSSKNGIPDRWLDYKSIGKRIPGTRFIAFKVPLKQSLNYKVPLADAFGPWELLATLKKQKEELGLIIDLTYTTRYYKPQDLPDSMSYLKIFTAGHEIPSDSTILMFKRAVRRFLRENTDNDKLIGVHCTHGLNRTGYLVCRYLIDVDGMDPKQAVEMFNSSRGHSIERENYLGDLQSGPKRSNEGMEEPDPEAEPERGRGGSEAPPPGVHRHQQRPLLPPPPLLGLPRLPCPPPLLSHHPPPLLPFPPYGGRWPPTSHHHAPPSRPSWRPQPPGNDAAHWRRPPPHGSEGERRGAGGPERRRAPLLSSPPEQNWRSAPPGKEERRRGPPPPTAPPYPLLLPRYVPRPGGSNGHAPPPPLTSDDPGRKPRHRHRDARRT